MAEQVDIPISIVGNALDQFRQLGSEMNAERDKWEERWRKPLKGLSMEVALDSLGKMSDALQTSEAGMRRFASEALKATEVVGKGFMQGGPVGGAIAATSMAISEGIKAWQEYDAAAKNALADIVSASNDARKAITDATRDLNKQADAAQTDLADRARAREQGVTTERVRAERLVQEAAAQTLAQRELVARMTVNLAREESKEASAATARTLETQLLTLEQRKAAERAALADLAKLDDAETQAKKEEAAKRRADERRAAREREAREEQAWAQRQFDAFLEYESKRLQAQLQAQDAVRAAQRTHENLIADREIAANEARIDRERRWEQVKADQDRRMAADSVRVVTSAMIEEDRARQERADRVSADLEMEGQIYEMRNAALQSSVEGAIEGAFAFADAESRKTQAEYEEEAKRSALRAAVMGATALARLAFGDVPGATAAGLSAAQYAAVAGGNALAGALTGGGAAPSVGGSATRDAGEGGARALGTSGRGRSGSGQAMQPEIVIIAGNGRVMNAEIGKAARAARLEGERRR